MPPPSPPPPTPEPGGPTGDVDAPPSALPPVPLTGSTATENGVSVSLADVSVIDGTAQGPGQVAGSAVKFTATVDNGSEQPIALSGLDVTADAGPDRTPGIPVE